MATNTTNNYFSKPAVGGDTDTWGTTLNTNWDTVDSVLAGDTDILALSVVPASASDVAATFSGNVGIGTNTPSSTLTVKSSNFSQLRLEDDDDHLEIGYSAARAFFKVGDDDSKISFRKLDLTDVMTVDMGNERVGIGTSSPTSPLDIRGSVNSNLDLAVYNQFDDDDEVAPNPSARLYLSAASNNAYLEAHGAPEDSAGLHKVDLGSSAAGSFLTFSPSGSEHMRIDSSGNVGIGTNSPDRTLHIKDSIAGIRLEDSDGTSYGEIIYNEGSNGLLIRSDENNADSGSNIIFEVDGSESARIDSSGNVGIGTSSPNEQLHLTNNLKVDGVIRSATFDSGTSTTVNVLCDDAGEAKLNLMGGNQGTGRLYVGQSSTYGGGIEYNGDDTPATSGGGADKIVLFRRDNGTDHWTARNHYNSNDWEFAGKVTADELAGTLAASIFNQIYPVGSIYISISPSFDPNNAFTGSWTQISGGEVLVAEGGSFTCGAGGGNSTHNHDVTVTRDGWGSYQPSTALREPSIDGRLITGSGSSEIGENLESLAEATGNKTFTSDNTSTYPPYRVVAIWKRNS